MKNTEEPEYYIKIGIGKSGNVVLVDWQDRRERGLMEHWKKERKTLLRCFKQAKKMIKE